MAYCEDNMRNESFYIVINATRGPSAQPVRHQHFEDAQKEARRIAVMEPGAKVHVFQSLGYAVKHDAEWRPAFDDGIPL